jgi:hypothetical protein
MAKCSIRICSAEDDFTPTQVQFIKRIACCLIQHHHLSVLVKMKVKKVEILKLKVV